MPGLDDSISFGSAPADQTRRSPPGWRWGWAVLNGLDVDVLPLDRATEFEDCSFAYKSLPPLSLICRHFGLTCCLHGMFDAGWCAAVELCRRAPPKKVPEPSRSHVSAPPPTTSLPQDPSRANSAQFSSCANLIQVLVCTCHQSERPGRQERRSLRFLR